jgi:hypothetical protein
VIATYRERRLSRKRDFTLFESHVLVHRRSPFGVESSVPIPLRTLEGQPSVIRVRNKNFNISLALAIIPLALFAMEVLGKDVQIPLPLQVCSGICIVWGVVKSLLTFRRIEYTRFHQLGYPSVVLLDVGRTGPDEARYDAFVQMLKEQVARASSVPKPQESPAR